MQSPSHRGSTPHFGDRFRVVVDCEDCEDWADCVLLVGIHPRASLKKFPLGSCSEMSSA